jgi:hypothetical protein
MFQLDYPAPCCLRSPGANGALFQAYDNGTVGKQRAASLSAILGTAHLSGVSGL